MVRMIASKCVKQQAASESPNQQVFNESSHQQAFSSQPLDQETGGSDSKGDSKGFQSNTPAIHSANAATSTVTTQQRSSSSSSSGICTDPSAFMAGVMLVLHAEGVQAEHNIYINVVHMEMRLA